MGPNRSGDSLFKRVLEWKKGRPQLDAADVPDQADVRSDALLSTLLRSSVHCIRTHFDVAEEGSERTWAGLLSGSTDSKSGISGNSEFWKASWLRPRTE